MDEPKARKEPIEMEGPPRGLTLTRKLWHGIRLELGGVKCDIVVTQIKGQQIRLTINGDAFKIDRLYPHGEPPR